MGLHVRIYISMYISPTTQMHDVLNLHLSLYVNVFTTSCNHINSVSMNVIAFSVMHCTYEIYLHKAADKIV